MDYQKLFNFRKLFSSLLINITMLTTLIEKTLSADQRFQACAPRNCGNGLKVSYPFWISQEQEPYCGYPDLEITCEDDKDPVLKISDDEYIIRDIFYSNNSLLLANAGVLTNACLTPTHNFSLDHTPFKYSFSHANLHIFYHCTLVPTEYHTYQIPCASNTSHYSFAAFVHEVTLKLLNRSTETCRSSIIVPVDLGDNDAFKSLFQMGYRDVLKKGFLLEWNASSCSECKGSGGRCGFDNNQFLCFCSDRPYTKRCKDETCDCADIYFNTCKPFNCGTGPNITYPFWVRNRQESYCGYPGFMVTCKDGKPVFNMSGDDYIIREIFHKNQSISVANTQASNQTCPPLIHSISLPDTLFVFGPAHVNLFLFFNCTNQRPNEYLSQQIDCNTDGTTRRSLAFFGDAQILKNASSLSRDCKTYLVVPFDQSGDLSETTIDTNYREMLRKGFLLNWKATNCTECKESGGSCGFNMTTYKFACLCSDRPHLRSCKRKGINLGKKLLIGFGAAGVGILLTSLIFLIYRCRRKRLLASSILISEDFSPSKVDIENGSTYFGIHVFTYRELEEATDHFDSSKELGDGGFGTVYYGKLRDGRAVAVKRLYENNYKRLEQFMNEVEILAGLRHQNLVTLYGCTSRHSRELLLVYEYISNGTVADHLHGDRAESGSVTWHTRMSIAIETANALTYLHASDIIHRDVKTNNILLDNNFSVKVADFGLSRLFPTDVTHVSTAPQGTPGYVDPEYHQCYQLTSKSDVYSFGVVLIELISSKPAVDISRHRHEINLANMAICKIQNRALHKLVDPSLGFETDCKVKRMITSVAELAFRCLQHERDGRPSMDDVLEILKEIQSDEYKVEKAGEVENPRDVIGLLKSSIPVPPSPDSVTDKWVSRSATPNGSS